MPHVKENLGQNATIRFHSCPKPDWYTKWSNLLNRKGFKFFKSTVVCSNHFEFGQPRLNSRHPSKYLKGYSSGHKTRKSPTERQEQSKIASQVSQAEEIVPKVQNVEDEESNSLTQKEQYELELLKLKEELKTVKDSYMHIIKEKDQQIEELKSRIIFGIDPIKGRDDQAKIFTGLPSYSLFKWAFDEVKEAANTMNYYSL
ncbi:uncharacterized protein LOC111335817 [Stylophora pistillata]|nr:uncharacterized protein LOC111335817 [Stylophora pistillata]